MTGSGTIIGTDANDVIVGSDGADTINGRGGDDLICALGGDDTIAGGLGDDRIDAGDGNDSVRGGVLAIDVDVGLRAVSLPLCERPRGDACKLSIASNASYISLYCFAADAKGYVAEWYVDRLPKASIGKACVRFKKLADLDEKALLALIKETAKMGLVA